MGELFAFLAALSFACANVMVKKGTTPQSLDNGAFLSVLITFGLSGLFTIGAGLMKGWPTLTSDGLWWFVLAGILTSFIGRSLLFSSIQHLGSVRASAIKRLNPFFTVMIGVGFLHEEVSGFIILGMICIFGGSVGLVWESFIASQKAKKEVAVTSEMKEHLAKSKRGSWDMGRWVRLLASFGYIYGIFSALAYAVGYVVRKKGLAEIPDPYLGTMVGAFIGILIFILFSFFKERYKNSIRLAFTGSNRWLFGAGLATSFGQILYFVALTYSGIVQVALIGSTDVILTLFLSAWIFKTHEGITLQVVLASVITMAGACFIAMG